MTDPAFTDVAFKKSSRSACGDNNCVEFGVGPDGEVLIRDSKDVRGPVLSFDAKAWTQFLGLVRSLDS